MVMEFVVLFACFAIPLIASVLAMRHDIDWAVFVMAAGFALLTAWTFWKGRQLGGWDGIGYAIIAIMVTGPALLGTLLGGAIGWWRRRRAKPLAADTAGD